MAERLKKFARFGMLQRASFAEIPPQVEYRFTPLGQAFCGLLDAVEELAERYEAGGFKSS